MVFRRIEVQMTRMGITKEMLAELTGIHYKALLQKLNGTRSFTLDEALKLKAAIQTSDSIEILFDRQEELDLP